VTCEAQGGFDVLGLGAHIKRGTDHVLV